MGRHPSENRKIACNNLEVTNITGLWLSALKKDDFRLKQEAAGKNSL